MPVLKSSIRIQGDYQLTASSQLLADPLLVLHFVLISINPKGNPARIVSELLSGFLLDQSFVYEEVVFDLSTDALIGKYTHAIAGLVHKLERWVFNNDFG